MSTRIKLVLRYSELDSISRNIVLKCLVRNKTHSIRGEKLKIWTLISFKHELIYTMALLYLYRLTLDSINVLHIDSIHLIQKETKNHRTKKYRSIKGLYHCQCIMSLYESDLKIDKFDRFL